MSEGRKRGTQIAGRVVHGRKCRVQSAVMDSVLSSDVLQNIGRPVFVCVDLDALTHNMTILANLCSNKETGRVAVVKGNAYGHGAVPVARYLMATGAADRLAVATVDEAVQLRLAGVDGVIHVLGNVQPWEMERCVRYRIIPTVASEQAIIGMAKCLEREDVIDISINGNHQNSPCEQRKATNRKRFAATGAIHIKVDSGMSRNGCQPHELPQLVEASKKYDVPLDGILSMFCKTEDPAFSQTQSNIFYKCIKPYRDDGYLFHMANSSAILANLATEMDLIRPGLSLYGLSPGFDLDAFVEMGFRPALSLKGTPTLVKRLAAGVKVGYGCTYACETDEWIATFPIGYADGLWRELGEGKSYIIRDKTGEKCPVVGRISMDAITVKLPCQPDEYELFTIITADYNPMTSVTGLAKRLGTIENEILIRISDRLPRVYLKSGRISSIQGALNNFTITNSLAY